jgi:hypothetical protein
MKSSRRISINNPRRRSGTTNSSISSSFRRKNRKSSSSVRCQMCDLLVLLTSRFCFFLRRCAIHAVSEACSRCDTIWDIRADQLPLFDHCSDCSEAPLTAFRYDNTPLTVLNSGRLWLQHLDLAGAQSVRRCASLMMMPWPILPVHDAAHFVDRLDGRSIRTPPDACCREW